MKSRELLHKQDILDTPRAKVKQGSQGNANFNSIITVNRSGEATEHYDVGHEKKLTPVQANDRLAQIKKRMKSSG